MAFSESILFPEVRNFSTCLNPFPFKPLQDPTRAFRWRSLPVLQAKPHLLPLTGLQPKACLSSQAPGSLWFADTAFLFLIFPLALACLALAQCFGFLKVIFNISLKAPSEEGLPELQCCLKEVPMSLFETFSFL